MHLIFKNYAIFNTPIEDDSGKTVYETYTPPGQSFLKGRETLIYRYDTNGEKIEPEIAKVVIASSMSGKKLVIAAGQDVTPTGAGPISKSEEFVSSNGQAYKWKAQLVGGEIGELLDSKKKVVATCNEFSYDKTKGKDRTTINISDDIHHLKDEIIATLIYMFGQKEKRAIEKTKNQAIRFVPAPLGMGAAQ